MRERGGWSCILLAVVWACGEPARERETASSDQTGDASLPTALWHDATDELLPATAEWTNKVELADIDGDGRIDLLFANGGNYSEPGEPELNRAFVNRGPRQPLEEVTDRVFGSTPDLARVIKARDFDGDGDMDVLTANGDNADYAPIPKRYHGVRLYLNDGGNHFEQVFFHPQHGAYKALAVDFDKDGDRDIAAISFFPDYEGSGGLESFVYLENRGEMEFAASTFPEALEARWLTMDAGDVDGDGDADIVLGGSVLGAGKVPRHLKQRWQEAAPSLLILKNRLVEE